MTSASEETRGSRERERAVCSAYLPIESRRGNDRFSLYRQSDRPIDASDDRSTPCQRSNALVLAREEEHGDNEEDPHRGRNCSALIFATRILIPDISAQLATFDSSRLRGETRRNSGLRVTESSDPDELSAASNSGIPSSRSGPIRNAASICIATRIFLSSVRKRPQRSIGSIGSRGNCAQGRAVIDGVTDDGN